MYAPFLLFLCGIRQAAKILSCSEQMSPTKTAKIHLICRAVRLCRLFVETNAYLSASVVLTRHAQCSLRAIQFVKFQCAAKELEQVII